MRIKQYLPVMVSGLSLLAVLSMSGAAYVTPDTTSRTQAIQMGLSQGKPIMLIVSDTNNCTGCIQLEYVNLPSTNPPMRDFLKESFIYWSCGPQEHCEDFRIYAGQGSVPLPSYFIIDPNFPDTYTVYGFGNADPIIFYNWAAAGLHVSAKPKIDNLANNAIVTNNNIVVNGRSVSTNVFIRSVSYKLNSGPWINRAATGWQNWQAALDPQAILPGPNTFQVYSVDSYYSNSQTNRINFTYQTNAVILPATVTLDNLVQTYDGNPKPVTTTTTPSGLAVNLTYNGLPNAPINSGAYTVIATVTTPNYQGGATNTLTISKGEAGVTLGNLLQTYDGTPKSATATTTPPGLTVSLTYNGLANVPVNAGSYTVRGIVSDSNYQGSATNTLVIAKAAATVTLGDLSQTYDGTAKAATATTTPTGLAVNLTYNGLPNAPTNVGNYTVIGTIGEPNYDGSATNTLVISEPLPLPLISSLSPAQVQPGGDVFSLYVNGSNFLANSVIRWNGTNLTTSLISGIRLRATIEPGLTASLGIVSITVFTPGGGESGAMPFTIGDVALAPVITNLSPSQVEPGGDVFSLYVNGTSFVTDSIIRWNGTNLTTSFVNTNRLRATIEPTLIVSPGSVTITVFNPGFGAGGESAHETLSIGTPSPTLTVERSDNSLTIGWPTNAIGFTLESTPILPGGTNWQPVLGSEATNLAIIPIDLGTNQFYRLKK